MMASVFDSASDRQIIARRLTDGSVANGKLTDSERALISQILDVIASDLWDYARNGSDRIVRAGGNAAFRETARTWLHRTLEPYRLVTDNPGSPPSRRQIRTDRCCSGAPQWVSR